MNERHASQLGELADARSERHLAPCNLEGFTRARLLAFLRTMRLIRSVEEQIATWVESGQARCPCHLGIGQEAIAAGVAAALRSSDRSFGNHRSHGHYLAAGGDVTALLAEVLGRVEGCSRGMGGSMHLVSLETGFCGSVPIVGGTVPIAVGAALAAKLDRCEDVAVAFFGDGACEEGVIHESLNLAATYGLPVVFVCENNLYSSHLDVALRQPSDRMARYAEAHCITAVVVDGNDVTAVARAAGERIASARSTSQPQFIEAVTYRWRGHVGAKEDIDVGVRRKMEDVAAWKRRDPIRRLETALMTSSAATPEQLDELAKGVLSEVSAAARCALDARWPAPQDLLELVYAERR